MLRSLFIDFNSYFASVEQQFRAAEFAGFLTVRCEICVWGVVIVVAGLNSAGAHPSVLWLLTDDHD